MISAGEIGIYGSQRHRDAWNLQAKEENVEFLQWKNDDGKLSQIDPGDVVVLADKISAEDKKKYGVKEDGSFPHSSGLWKVIKNISKKLEAKRQELLEQSVAMRKDIDNQIDLSALSDEEQRLFLFVQNDLLPAINDFNNIRLDPRLPEWAKKIARAEKQGDKLSAREWERRRDDVCYPAIEDIRCSLFSDFPNQRPQFGENPIWTVIPSDITDAGKKWMEEFWKGPQHRNPFYSAFTVDEHDGDGGYKWTPLSLHPKTAEVTRRLAESFARGAKLNTPYAKIFRAWQEALQSTAAYPFDAAEKLTVQLDEGNLELSLDVSPNGVSFGKSGIALMGGALRQKEAEFAKTQVRPVLQDAENDLEKLTGGVYKAVTIRENPVRFVNFAFEDDNMHQQLPGEVLAYVFPAGTETALQGFNKKVVGVNHINLKFEHLYLPIAKAALDPSQLPLVTERGETSLTVNHEMSHMLGPQAGSKTANGKTVQQNLAAINDRIEESKADLGGIHLFPYLLKRGSIDQQIIDEAYVTYVVGLLRQMRMDLRHHGGGAAMVMGFLLDRGAVTITEENPDDQRLHVVLEKMPEALDQIWADTVKLQMTGTEETAKKVMNDWSKKSLAFAELKEPQLTKLGIPRDLRIHYKFRGLRVKG